MRESWKTVFGVLESPGNFSDKRRVGTLFCTSLHCFETGFGCVCDHVRGNGEAAAINAYCKSLSGAARRCFASGPGSRPDNTQRVDVS